MNSLFGVELPTSVNFVIAFVVVLALIGAATWLVKRLGATRIDAAARGRQPRLAVVDAASIDARRKLVIIRRDNIEHLLMIGGPSDVVVETNIVRAATTSTRDTAAPRSGGAETLPRAMPLPDPTSWPLQPEPVPAPAMPAAAAALRPDRARAAMDEPMAWSGPAEPATIPSPPSYGGARPDEPYPNDMTRPVSEPMNAPPRMHAPEPARSGVIQPHAAPVADQNLAEMAHRLEAALRRPASPGPAGKAPEVGPPRAANEARPAPRADAKAAAAAPAKPGAGGGPQRAPLSDIEQEMASLLGRPGKP